jgi:predicted tellurium resistance membrane protein TerC
MEWIADPQAWIGLLTLTVLEIVLGIDNIIFISILSSTLPKEQQAQARRLGLMGAFVTRILLLLSIAWIVRLTAPLFTIAGIGFSGRALILLLGGLFLIGKATYEIHEKLEGHEASAAATAKVASMQAVIVQIMLVDIVFSLDSVITAVGMVSHVPIMIAANVIALGVMLLAATPISDFVDQHPTIKILALAFLVLIGTNLVAEGLGHHIPKGYTYFAMAFSFLVEMINLRMRAAAGTAPVKLHQTLRTAEVALPGAGSSGGGGGSGGAPAGTARGRRKRRR